MTTRTGRGGAALVHCHPARLQEMAEAARFQ
jgi:hypothetical protein